jgi:hypothetical protein
MQLTAASECLAISTTRVGTLEGDLRAANSSLESLAARVPRLEAALESTQKLLEAARAEGKQASKAHLKLAAHAKTDAEGLRQSTERMAGALAELRLLPSPIPAGPISEIALWYADALRHLGTLLGMLKQRLETEGEHIVKIVGTTILPRVQHLSPSFLFPCLFEGFSKSKEGKDTQDTARAAIARVVADLKRRMTRALPRS